MSSLASALKTLTSSNTPVRPWNAFFQGNSTSELTACSTSIVSWLANRKPGSSWLFEKGKNHESESLVDIA
jgi:hypothetical protein